MPLTQQKPSMRRASRWLATISIALLVGSFLALPFLGSYAPCESTGVRDLARFAVPYTVIAASLACIGLSLTRLPTRSAVAVLALVALAFSALNLTLGEAMWYEHTKGGGLALETGWYAAYGFPLKSFYVHLGAGPSRPTAGCGVLRPWSAAATDLPCVLLNAIAALLFWLAVLALWELVAGAKRRAYNPGPAVPDRAC